MQKKYDESQYIRDISPITDLTLCMFGAVSILLAVLEIVFDSPQRLNIYINFIDACVFLPVFIFRKNISFYVRSAIIVIFPVLGILLTTLKTGIYGTSPIVFVGLITMVSIILPIKYTIAFTGFMHFLFGVLVVLVQNDLYVFSERYLSDLNDTVLWYPFFFASLSVNIIIISSVHFLKKKMVQNISCLENSNELLLQKEKELKYLAYYDTLTGLPKKSKFIEDLKQKEENGQLAEGYILHANIKQFRSINRLLGTVKADEILHGIARTISRRVQYPNMAARLIGDEFVFWVEGADPERVKQFAKVLYTPHPSEEILNSNNISINFHLSAALYSPGQGVSIEECIKNASLALPAARNLADKQIYFFKKEILRDVEHEMTLLHQLEIAISNYAFTLAYQKKIDLSTLEVVGVEALARWKDKDGNSVSPTIFIPIISRHNLMIPFSKMIFDLVLMDVQKIEEKYGSRTTVAINISPFFFLARDFPDFVKQKLDVFGISGEKIILEVTEDVYVEDITTLNQIIQQLKILGIRISLDDFGTGFSSLSYIGEIDLDELKIDKLFVQGIENEGKKREIIQSVCDIAKALNYKVVAEGVETQAQLEHLQQTPCDMVQGFYFDKPVPLDVS